MSSLHEIYDGRLTVVFHEDTTSRWTNTYCTTLATLNNQSKKKYTKDSNLLEPIVKKVNPNNIACDINIFSAARIHEFFCGKC